MGANKEFDRNWEIILKIIHLHMVIGIIYVVINWAIFA